MLKFDPVNSRKKMLEMLSFHLDRNYDATPAMGNTAAGSTDSIIKFWLLGLQKEIAPILPRTYNWLSIAINQDEDYGMHHNFHREFLRSRFALLKWLKDGEVAVKDWEEVRVIALSNLHDDSVYTKGQRKIEGLDKYMSICIQSENYEAGIIEFEKFYSTKNFSLKKIKTPKMYGCAICLNETTQQFDKEDVLLAGKRMIQANIEKEWLSYGKYFELAVWLKNVYWYYDRNLTPLETILKAYDNMPNVAL